jgi:ribosomal protein L11 methyltransferase
LTAAASSGAWLELAVEVDHEAVEPVTELFAGYGYNEGVAIEEPFVQEPDGDHLTVDLSRPVWVRTFLAADDVESNTLDDIRSALWHLGMMRQVGELIVTERNEEDWANAWKEYYKPFRAGHRVVITPPWQEFEATSPSDVVVILDPGMAFGTGSHPSSRLALFGIEESIKPGDSVLDVGTGSGILAISAVKLGALRVDALDIEPVAVRTTLENAERNCAATSIRARVGSVTPDNPFAQSYDLVVANIIARVLIEIADGLDRAVKPGGTLVLSGIIESKELLVREAFEPRGLTLVNRSQMDDWIGLTYRAPDRR